MNLPKFLSLILFVSLFLSLTQRSWASSAEEDRLRGYSEHKSENDLFDKTRAKGERAFLEEAEQWENQRRRDSVEYKKQKKTIELKEDGPEAKADVEEKNKWLKDAKESHREYVKERAQIRSDILDRKKKGLPTEQQELNIAEERQRFNYKTRPTFGGKYKWGKSESASSSSGGGYTSPSYGDFGGGSGGYVPPPSLPEDYGDVPMPPPPVPGFGEDSLGGGFNNDFSMPPPPPPMGDF